MHVDIMGLISVDLIIGKIMHFTTPTFSQHCVLNILQLWREITFSLRLRCVVLLINPLSFNSDQNLLSPYTTCITISGSVHQTRNVLMFN